MFLVNIICLSIDLRFDLNCFKSFFAYEAALLTPRVNDILLSSCITTTPLL